MEAYDAAVKNISALFFCLPFLDCQQVMQLVKIRMLNKAITGLRRHGKTGCRISCLMCPAYGGTALA